MTFYTPKPVLVEAYKFEGGSNATDILSWLARHNLTTAVFFAEEQPYMGPLRKFKKAYIPAQLDLGIPHIKIAEVGDYIVRVTEHFNDGMRLYQMWKVLPEFQFKAVYDQACGTCSGPTRETVNLVCQNCGHDFSKGD